MNDVAVDNKISEKFFDELRSMKLIQDYSLDGDVIPYYTECGDPEAADWCNLEEILWYVLWLLQTKTESERWWYDYSSK